MGRFRNWVHRKVHNEPSVTSYNSWNGHSTVVASANCDKPWSRHHNDYREATYVADYHPQPAVVPVVVAPVAHVDVVPYYTPCAPAPMPVADYMMNPWGAPPVVEETYHKKTRTVTVDEEEQVETRVRPAW